MANSFTVPLSLMPVQTCDEAAGTQALVDARAAIKKQLIDKMQQRVASGDSRASHLTQQEVNNLVDATYQDQCFAKVGNPWVPCRRPAALTRQYPRQ